MHIYTRFRAKDWGRRIGAVAVAMAMLAAVVACDPEEAQPTDAPPSATAVMPSPTPTLAPTATPSPTSNPTPEPTPAPTATSAPTVEPTATPTPISTSTPTPTPEPTATPAQELQTAQEVLDAASAAMASVETGSVRMEIESTLDGPIFFETKIVVHGDFQAPDRSRFTTVATSGGSSLEYDSIVIGMEGYQENPFSGVWEASPDAFIFLGEASHLGKLDLGLETEVVELITLVGVVDLDGVSVYYLSGALPADAAADLVGDSSLENKAYDAPVETEMWIGVEDFLVRKLGVRFKQTDAISGTSLAGQTIMTFSDYGKAVDIQAPGGSVAHTFIPFPPATLKACPRIKRRASSSLWSGGERECNQSSSVQSSRLTPL